LANTHRQHIDGDKIITKKYRNVETPQTTKHTRFLLLHKSNDMQTPNQCTNNDCIAVGRHHIGVISAYIYEEKKDS